MVQSRLFPLFNQYYDVMWAGARPTLLPQLREAYLLHALNHVLKYKADSQA